MRQVFLTALGAAMLLAACDAWETAPPPPPPQPAPITETAPPAFEDNGCLGYLLLQRAAILEGRAEGSSGALEAPIAAWRARGAQTLSAEELTQYETSSVAAHGDEGAEAIATRAGECAASAPSQGEQQQSGRDTRNDDANPQE